MKKMILGEFMRALIFLCGIVMFCACDTDHRGPDPCGDGEISAADAVWSHGEGDLQNTKKVAAARTKRCLMAPLDTPTIQWSFDIGGGGTGAAPVIAEDGTIYLVGEYPGAPIGGGIRNAGLLAISNSGQLKWFFQKPLDLGSGNATAPFYTTSVSFGTDGSIYVGFWDSTFYALNTNGEILWSYESDYNFTANPVVDGSGNVYSATDSIFSFSPSGTIRWRFGHPNFDTGCFGLALGKTTIVARYPIDGVVGLNLKGQLVWQYPITGFTGHYGILLDEQDNIYLKIDNNNLISLDKSGSVRWESTAGGLAGISDLVLRGDYLYFASFNSLYRLHKDSGNVVHHVATCPNYFDPFMSPLVDDNGNVIIASRWAGWQSVQHIPANTPLIACVSHENSKLWEIPVLGAEFSDLMGYLALSPTGQIVVATYSGASQNSPTNRLYLLQ